MPKAQYQWQGATYEVRAPRTIDELDIEHLAVSLGGARGGRHWSHALNYARFVVLTTLVAGVSAIPMMNLDSPISEMRAAMDKWLDAEGHLDEWRNARQQAATYTPDEETANPPNVSTTPNSDENGANSSDELTTSSSSLPDPLSA